jgi:hypothetical protein
MNELTVLFQEGKYIWSPYTNTICYCDGANPIFSLPNAYGINTIPSRPIGECRTRPSFESLTRYLSKDAYDQLLSVFEFIFADFKKIADSHCSDSTVMIITEHARITNVLTDVAIQNDTVIYAVNLTSNGQLTPTISTGEDTHVTLFNPNNYITQLVSNYPYNTTLIRKLDDTNYYMFLIFTGAVMKNLSPQIRRFFLSSVY